MKKLKFIFMAAVICFTAAYCGKTPQEDNKNPGEEVVTPGGDDEQEKSPLDKILDALPKNIRIGGENADLFSVEAISTMEDYELWLTVRLDGAMYKIMLAISAQNDGVALDLSKSDPLASRDDGSWVWSAAMYDSANHLISNILWGGPEDDGGLLAPEGSAMRIKKSPTEGYSAKFDVKAKFPLEVEGRSLEISINLNKSVALINFL